MKIIKFILLSLLVAATLTSCQKINGKGEVIRTSRDITGYNEIEMAFDATVYYTQGDYYSLEIEAQENLIGYIETTVKGNDLVIREKNGINFGKHDPIRIYITAPGIISLDISGSGAINVNQTWAGNDLLTSISGSGTINIPNLQCNRITSDISGSGNIEMNGGSCNYEDFTISGSGSIDMRMVECDTTYAGISGSGDIYANIRKLLDATIAGSGNIYYYGTPAINTQISGSGNIQRL
jgi:hypothetical protein